MASTAHGARLGVGDGVGDVVADTCRILAIRVEFPLEDPDEPSTTGTGRFDLRSLSEALPDYAFPYDTPPHDRTFYEHQLQALSRYYQVVSNGRLSIEYTVLPRQTSGAYRLPKEALLYGNGRSTAEIGEKWIDFIRDAVAAADEDAVFSDFDSFLFIHPGQGQESGEINDIRSVYLPRRDLDMYGGPTPIGADGGAFELPHAWIVPEMADRFGRAGLNGLLAKFFGFVLGLPSLSNSARGTPALGTWSLMDVGATGLGYVLDGDTWEPVFGFVPPHLMAWSKARLGWIEPLVVRRDTTVKIVATDRHAGGLPKSVRVPIAHREYFLLENRQQRGNFGVPQGLDPPFAGVDEVVWIPPQGIEFTHSITGEEAGEKGELEGHGSGVWAAVDEYDAFVPGSGILIWHVDESVIEERFEEGINNDRARPGIALEEADGFRHIGNLFFDQQHLTEGTPTDPFFAGTGPGGASSTTTFGPQTRPPSTSNDGADTGIEIVVLSELADTMEVQIQFNKVRGGWPRPVASAGRLQGADLDGDGDLELLVEDESGVQIVSADGAARAAAGARLAAATDGGSTGAMTALFLSVDGVVRAFGNRALPEGAAEIGAATWEFDLSGLASEPHSALFAADLSSFPGERVLVLGAEGSVFMLDADSGERKFDDEVEAGSLSAADLSGDGSAELVVASSDGGEGWVISANELAPLWSENGRHFGPACGDLDADGRAEVIIVSETGSILATGIDKVMFRTEIAADTISATPILGDLDGDGFLEIVAASSNGVHAIRSNGLIQAGFPVVRDVRELRFAPVLADLDGDGRQEIFTGSTRGLYGFDDTGVPLEGFPLLTETPISYDPVAGDLDGDGHLEIAAVAGNELYLWEPTALSPAYGGGTVAWGQRGRSAAGRFSHPTLPAGPTAPIAADLLPPELAYCYPNPVGGEDDRAHLRFFLSRLADVELEVFDVLGERLDRIRVGRDELQVPDENEISWPTEKYASGLYLCQLEADAGAGARSHVVVKMAVSK